MDALGKQLLAGARLAGNQYGRIGRCVRSGQLFGVADGCRFADDLMKVVFGRKALIVKLAADRMFEAL